MTCETLRGLKALFETSFYHISLSRDVVGLECAVALKNAYALGVSLAIGLSERSEGGGREHYNSQAALFLQGVREMRGLLKLSGGGDDNIAWGAGDLYVTVFGGRSRMIGTLLGRGLSVRRGDAVAGRPDARIRRHREADGRSRARAHRPVRGEGGRFPAAAAHRRHHKPWG